MASYKLNEAKMFADITDNVAIIINGETGIYYGMNGFGTAIFENLIKGVSVEAILEELKKIPNILPNIEEKLNSFINIILEKELIILSDESSEIKAEIDASFAINDEFALNVNEYNDAQELLLADPIHEVKEEIGWSPEIEALNPDKEDVARREAKMEN